MRVITGTARGTKLFSIQGNKTRPTSQRIKEAQFSVIQFLVEGSVVLDLFAGTGQLGIEALSRGAIEAVFVDNDDDAIKVIRNNLKKTYFTNKAKVVKSDVFRYISNLRREFDIVFVDAPYGIKHTSRVVQMIGSHIAENGIVLCETELNAFMPEETEDLKLSKQYRYSQSMIWYYRKYIDTEES